MSNILASIKPKNGIHQAQEIDMRIDDPEHIIRDLNF